MTLILLRWQYASLSHAGLYCFIWIVCQRKQDNYAHRRDATEATKPTIPEYGTIWSARQKVRGKSCSASFGSVAQQYILVHSSVGEISQPQLNTLDLVKLSTHPEETAEFKQPATTNDTYEEWMGRFEHHVIVLRWMLKTLPSHLGQDCNSY